MRRLPCLLCFFLLLSCNLQVQDFSGGFSVPYQSQQTSSLRLLVLTDLHIGKEGIQDAREDFLAWLETSGTGYDQILVLGDLTQCGLQDQLDNAKAFLDEASRISGCPYVALIGNHDIRNGGRRRFESLFGQSTYYSFALGGYSFYVLDTADRLVGLEQLQGLKDTIAIDGNRKIALSHMPIYCGIDCIEASLCDPYERYELVKAMEGFDLYLCGHAHYGTSHHYDSSFSELTFPTFCGIDRIFESQVKWNELILDSSCNQVLWNCFSITKEGSINIEEIERFSMSN